MLVVVANLSLVYVAINMYSEQKFIEMNRFMHEFEEIDIAYMCSISNCKYIKYNGVLYQSDNRDSFTSLYETKTTIEDMFSFSEHGVFTTSFNIKIKLSPRGSTFIVIDSSILNPFKYQLPVIIFVFILLNLGLLSSSIFHHRKQMLIENEKTKTESFSKNIIILTENIHHELNTPLAVISNKFNKLESFFSNSIYLDYNEVHSEQYADGIYKDFKILKASIGQIKDILDRLKKFKGFKNNSSDNLYNVIDATVSAFLTTQSEKFDFEIDEGLKLYKSTQDYITNGVLMGVILNMIKNSIEANSTNIKFSCSPQIDGFYVADDGNGIPDNIVSKIYDEDFTTKNKQGRGNGLFINNSILGSGGGSLRLIKTDIYGTIFKINIHMEKI